MSGDLESTLLAREQARCAAMLSHDLVALDALLDPRLCFSHATGEAEDKAAYCAKLAAGRITYLSIDWSEQRVIPLSEGAVLITGRMAARVRVEDVEKQLDNRVLAAWAKSAETWRLVAFQSTPLRLKP